MQEFFQQLREQIGRVWGDLSLQQRILFFAAPVILLIAMGIAVYYASRPEMVQLVSMEDLTRLNQIKEHLDLNNIRYDIRDQNTILVDKSMRNKIALDLAGENLIGPDTGPGLELFDQVRLGMTESMFEVQYKRALENELEYAISDGSRAISKAFVRIVIPKDRLFKDQQQEPTATVKVHLRGSISQQVVNGVQRMVAASVEGMDPQKVVVTDGQNKLLSEDTEVQPGVARATKHYQYQKIIESDYTQKVERALEDIVGPGNYNVNVTVKLDWREEESRKIDIDTKSKAPVSTKTYEEESKTTGIAGQPGVGANVQDTGIGAEETLQSSNITEDIVNNQYPWAETFIKEEQGEVDSISVGVALNYNNVDDEGNPIPRDPQLLDNIERKLRMDIGMPVASQPNDPYQMFLFETEFDTSYADQLASERFWNNVYNVFQTLIPLLLLLALGYFAYIFFQRAFAPPEVEEEELEEEVPIEPVTEAKELTLSQLGLAEFGDIASLPAEEQRRLKMQEHVINYAAEKPEEVAAIIKAWLSS